MSKTSCNDIKIIGAGLAGSEAAWQLAKRGVHVTLYEMRPVKNTPAHQTDLFGELVCSNSLGGDKLSTTAGILHAELELLDSLIMKAARESSVPAGNALAVDRNLFAEFITETLNHLPNVDIVTEEVTSIEDKPTIIATGPLTSPSFAVQIAKLTGEEFLYFYDAVAPIVDVSTIDMTHAFKGNRWGNEGDYINCPMNKEEYDVFYTALVEAETAPRHSFEEAKHFEGCLPIEVIAKRGEQTLVFGPLRPVGFEEFTGGKRPYAVVQLRQDNTDRTLYNIVGFQTNLKWGEQERVFRLIPALKNAEFVRKGVMHRNLFVNAPRVLDEYLRFKNNKQIFIAGQASGVEGYVESSAMGLAAGIFAFATLSRLNMPKFPIETAIGSLLNYLQMALPSSFQPMNVNLGIMPKLDGKKIKSRAERCEATAQRALKSLQTFIESREDIFF